MHTHSNPQHCLAPVTYFKKKKSCDRCKEKKKCDRRKISLSHSCAHFLSLSVSHPLSLPTCLSPSIPLSLSLPPLSLPSLSPLSFSPLSLPLLPLCLPLALLLLSLSLSLPRSLARFLSLSLSYCTTGVPERLEVADSMDHESESGAANLSLMYPSMRWSPEIQHRIREEEKDR